MAQSYEKRLLIDIKGNETISGTTIATGYERIVIGQRGPYIEFSKGQIDVKAIFIPEDQRYRLTSGRVYYNEWRSHQDDVKLYEQKRTVAYADYLVGMWYVSPFDLKANGQVIIHPLKK